MMFMGGAMCAAKLEKIMEAIQDYAGQQNKIAFIRGTALNEIEALLTFDMDVIDMRTCIARILADCKARLDA